MLKKMRCERKRSLNTPIICALVERANRAQKLVAILQVVYSMKLRSFFKLLELRETEIANNSRMICLQQWLLFSVKNSLMCFKRNCEATKQPVKWMPVDIECCWHSELVHTDLAAALCIMIVVGRWFRHRKIGFLSVKNKCSHIQAYLIQVFRRMKTPYLSGIIMNLIHTGQQLTHKTNKTNPRLAHIFFFFSSTVCWFSLCLSLRFLSHSMWMLTIFLT